MMLIARGGHREGRKEFHPEITELREERTLRPKKDNKQQQHLSGQDGGADLLPAGGGPPAPLHVFHLLTRYCRVSGLGNTAGLLQSLFTVTSAFCLLSFSHPLLRVRRHDGRRHVREVPGQRLQRQQGVRRGQRLLLHQPDRHLPRRGITE